MKYRVKVVIENCDTGLFSESERTVTLSLGKMKPPQRDTERPIDANQKDRLIRWAGTEALEEALHDRR